MEENNTNDIMSKLKEKNLKVVAVTKHNYTLKTVMCTNTRLTLTMT